MNRIQDPGTNNSGVFYLEEKEMTIDYTKLNQQITKQAIGDLVLTEEMKRRLFEDKFKRAEAELKSRQIPARTER